MIKSYVTHMAGSAIMITLVKLLEIADLLPACLQNLFHLLEREVLIHHQHQQMIEQVTDFFSSLPVLPIFRGNNDLAALLTAFFQDLVSALSNK